MQAKTIVDEARELRVMLAVVLLKAKEKRRTILLNG